MRIRPLASLSLVAAAAFVLAGCSAGGSPSPETSSSESAAAATDLCAAAAPSGAASESVTVSGDAGAAPTLSFTSPLEVTEAERTVVTEGTGDAIASGDLISYAFTAYNADTGEQLGTLGYAEGEVAPAQITPESALGAFFGCATTGSRIVVTLPASDTNPAAVYALDLLSVVPSAAWGEPQAPVEGLPTVELDADGAPTITIPEGVEAPTDVQLETLKLGDGAVVQPGDTVLVQYRGVKWSDGTEFDSSWSRGAPASFPTTGVVDGFRQALENQTVGSQVLVVIPPAFGYGADETSELKDETLVFVVDILGVQHAAAG